MTLLTISNPPTARGHRRPAFSAGRAAALACIAALMPLGTALAQSARLVRVTSERTAIRSHKGTSSDVVMTAERGAAFEVIHTDGDRFVHRERNWYWVLLPRDAWGTQRAGWLSGKQVEEVERTETVAATSGAGVMPREALDAQVEQRSSVRPVASAAAQPVTRMAPPSAAAPPVAPAQPVADVVLNFEFAKSALTDEARAKLGAAIAGVKGSRPLSLAIEGYADAIGSEAFNKQLGLERAETVRRHLTEQHHIAADQIGVISHGENQPVASNATAEGRAENRRVVIKVGP